MKKFILGLSLIFISSPIISKADEKLVDIKEIRGEKNHYEDLLLDNVSMYYDISLFDKYNIDPKSLGVNIDSNDIYIDASKKEDKNSKSNSGILGKLNKKNFTLSSGAGAWNTKLKFIDDKGNFEVEFKDTDYDKTYVSKALGKFSIDKKVNDTCYILNLDQIKVTSPTGKSENKNGLNIEYYKMPHGMEAKEGDQDNFAKKFTLYLPHRKRSEMSDKLNSWLNTSYMSKNIDENESRVFILVNNNTIFPFVEDVD